MYPINAIDLVPHSNKIQLTDYLFRRNLHNHVKLVKLFKTI